MREIAGTIRSFLDREVVPLERQLFARGFGSLSGELDRLREEVKRRGLFSPHLPREWGGGGMSLLELAHVGEVLGRSSRFGSEMRLRDASQPIGTAGFLL